MRKDPCARAGAKMVGGTMWVRARRIRCPRCGAEPRMLREYLTGFCTEFEYRNGHRTLHGENLETGNPFMVEARCDCGHKWRLRGATSILSVDIPEEVGE